jgi:hypothetical protein
VVAGVGVGVDAGAGAGVVAIAAVQDYTQVQDLKRTPMDQTEVYDGHRLKVEQESRHLEEGRKGRQR